MPTVYDVVDDVEQFAVLLDDFQRTVKGRRSFDVEFDAGGTEGAPGGRLQPPAELHREHAVEKNVDW